MRTSLQSQVARLAGTLAACVLLVPACSQVSAQPALIVGQPVQANDNSGNDVANASEARKLQVITGAFDAFHRDTGGWPLGDGVWTASTRPELKPGEFTIYDTALFTKPASLQLCSQHESPCWNGPYLSGGSSLADPAFNDEWGHKHLFAYYRPLDYLGGGAASAPNGAALLWSRGPDGIDHVGCTDGHCARDHLKIATGQPSVDGADDIIITLAVSTK